MVEKWPAADPHPDSGECRPEQGSSSNLMCSELSRGRPPGQLHRAHSRPGGRGGGAGVPGHHARAARGQGAHLAPACPVWVAGDHKRNMNIWQRTGNSFQMSFWLRQELTIFVRLFGSSLSRALNLHLSGEDLQDALLALWAYFVGQTYSLKMLKISTLSWIILLLWEQRGEPG